MPSPYDASVPRREGIDRGTLALEQINKLEKRLKQLEAKINRLEAEVKRK